MFVLNPYLLCLWCAGDTYFYFCVHFFLPAAGNLRHLIVEACIAKKLLDTSAYLWPGYVNTCSNQIPCSISNHVSGMHWLMS